ncbi:hypothetical protein PanWU01x14_058370, partial [Parasponia andersonii]
MQISWELFDFGLNFPQMKTWLFQDILLNIYCHHGKNRMQLFLVLCWSIWCNRNKIAHGQQARLPMDTYTWYLNYLREFQTAQQQSTSAFSTQSAPKPTKWQLPSIHGYK